MRSVIIYFLVISVGSFPGLFHLSYAAITDKTTPILYHMPPIPLPQGETLVIQSVVEDESSIASVNLWFRVPGKERYQNIIMNETSRSTYEGRLEVSKDFKNGIEYYVEAVDEFGNTGTDGTKARPYFVEVRERAHIPSSTSASMKGVQKSKRHLWKNPWLWLGVLLAVGGGVAAARSGSKEGDNTGTIIVE